MPIAWSALGEVAVVSIAVTVGVVVIFALGVLPLSHHETEIDRGRNGTVALTGAVLCSRPAQWWYATVSTSSFPRYIAKANFHVRSR